MRPPPHKITTNVDPIINLLQPYIHSPCLIRVAALKWMTLTSTQSLPAPQCHPKLAQEWVLSREQVSTAHREGTDGTGILRIVQLCSNTLLYRGGFGGLLWPKKPLPTQNSQTLKRCMRFNQAAPLLGVSSIAAQLQYIGLQYHTQIIDSSIDISLNQRALHYLTHAMGCISIVTHCQTYSSPL